MPMASQNKIMGKVKSPSFFKGSTSQSSPSKASSIKRNFPVLFALVLLGVAIILFLRSRSSSSTGPVLNLIGTSPSDQFAIDNLTASILALQGLVHVPSPIPGGGTSTPISNVPTSTNPGSGSSSSGGNASYVAPYPNATAYGDILAWLKSPSWTPGRYSYEEMIQSAKDTGGTVYEQGARMDALTKAESIATTTRLVNLLKSGVPTAEAYKQATGMEPGTPENRLNPTQYLNEVLNQFPGSPVAGNYGDPALYDKPLYEAKLKYMLGMKPEEWIGVNSGRPDPVEYQNFVDSMRAYLGIKP
uniref:Uncharacterized protein n=1 Tax=viral metagenome TaxID=1070528 RepID=A0A6M3LKV4_9ZZZZ